MFAVLKTGGKQYKVTEGDMLRVEKLAAEKGESVQFNEVLMIGGDPPILGAPYVKGAAVQAEVVDQIKGEKVVHFVRRRRKHSSKRTKGHRQLLTEVRVTQILPSGGDGTGLKAAAGAGSAPAEGSVTGEGKPAAKRVAKSAGARTAEPGADAGKPADVSAAKAEAMAGEAMAGEAKASAAKDVAEKPGGKKPAMTKAKSEGAKVAEPKGDTRKPAGKGQAKAAAKSGAAKPAEQKGGAKKPAGKGPAKAGAKSGGSKTSEPKG